MIEPANGVGKVVLQAILVRMKTNFQQKKKSVCVPSLFSLNCANSLERLENNKTNLPAIQVSLNSYFEASDQKTAVSGCQSVRFRWTNCKAIGQT